MKPKLIGLILKTLVKEYNTGACDDLPQKDYDELLSSLTQIHDKLTNKVEETMTTEQASVYLKVTRLTINNYVKEGKLHPKKQLGGVLLYNKNEVIKLKNKQHEKESYRLNKKSLNSKL